MSTKNTAIDRACYTLEEFCLAHRISRAHFYDLEKEGRAPKRMANVGKKVLISVEAAEQWRREMEAEAEEVAF